MTASQVTPGAPPLAGATGGFTAPGTTDQDWNMAAGATTTTHDWGAEDGGDWGSTEPKVGGHTQSNSCH